MNLSQVSLRSERIVLLVIFTGLAVIGSSSRAIAQSGPFRVVHAASFEAGPLSAGQLFTVFGDDIGPVQPLSGSLDANGVIPGVLGGVEVLVGGRRAPLLYVSRGQINAQAPYAIEGLSVVLVSVRYHGRVVGERTLPVAPTTLEFFVNPYYARKAVLVNQDGVPNGPRRPARRGEVVAIYGTGAGGLRPVGDEGRPVGLPLPTLVHPIDGFFVGGSKSGDLEILYAGPAPGLIGLWQINIRVPPALDPTFKGALHLVFSSADSSSSAFMAVGDSGPIEDPDYYITGARLSKTNVKHGEKIDVDFTIGNMGEDGRLPFSTYITFRSGSGEYGQVSCSHQIVYSASWSRCTGELTIPASLPYGEASLVLQTNRGPRATLSGDVTERNASNNIVAMRFTVLRPDGSSGSALPRQMVIEGPLTVDGKQAQFRIEAYRTLSGEDEVLGYSYQISSASAPNVVFVSSGFASANGQAITVPIFSDAAVVGGGSSHFDGNGTLVLSLPSRQVGASATADVTITYRDGYKLTGQFRGTIQQLEE